ncbi:MAG: ArnT family glycosyltransferase [Isosphaeraceae bacterium]
MAQYRSLLAIALLAASLHAWAVSRTLLPAQDGLKFIRVARQFQTAPWAVVIRGADVHPLYPALIATAEPLVAWCVGKGPDAWRIAAQVIAAISSIGLLFPVYFLTRSLFDRRIAFIAAGLLALLPRAAEMGHDTLADSLALFATFVALWLGARALRSADWRIGVGSGLVAGAGYLARPEVILVPVAIGLTWSIGQSRRAGRSRISRLNTVSMMLLAAALIVVSYAAFKGEISEKLAVRYGAWLGPQSIVKRPVPQQVPRGLDDPRLDFSPKEEADQIPIRGWRSSIGRIVGKWWEQLCWGFAVMTVWGLVRRRYIRGLLPDRDPADADGLEGRLLLTFAGVYGLALLRHSTALGYLSGRHVMALVVASIPWAAAGTYVCCRGIALSLRWDGRWSRPARVATMVVAVVGSIATQMQPNHLNHLSRWGHWSAGRWLATHARPEEEVLDTRGWGKFISGQPGYDYWHVRQALTDSHLSYILVGLDELDAASARATTLKALLAYSATPLVEFPASPGDSKPAVRLYRFHSPASWEGLTR